MKKLRLGKQNISALELIQIQKKKCKPFVRMSLAWKAETENLMVPENVKNLETKTLATQTIL